MASSSSPRTVPRCSTRRRCERLLTQYERLLAAAIAAPETRVDALPLVSADGARGAGGGGDGAGGRGAGGASTVAGLLAARWRRGRRRWRWRRGDATWTYAALGAAAGQVAGVLRAAGVGPNVPVGVWLPREAELLITVAGIVGAGGGYVPLDPTQPRARGGGDVDGDGGPRGGDDAAAVAAGTVPAGPWTVVPLEAVAGRRRVGGAGAGGGRRTTWRTCCTRRGRRGRRRAWRCRSGRWCGWWRRRTT